MPVLYLLLASLDLLLCSQRQLLLRIFIVRLPFFNLLSPVLSMRQVGVGFALVFHLRGPIPSLSILVGIGGLGIDAPLACLDLTPFSRELAVPLLPHGELRLLQFLGVFPPRALLHASTHPSIILISVHGLGWVCILNYRVFEGFDTVQSFDGSLSDWLILVPPGMVQYLQDISLERNDLLSQNLHHRINHIYGHFPGVPVLHCHTLQKDRQELLAMRREIAFHSQN